MGNKKPCIERASHLQPEVATKKYGDYLSGCDFMCQRIVGGVACQYFFRFETADEMGVSAKVESFEPCQKELHRQAKKEANAPTNSDDDSASEVPSQPKLWVASHNGTTVVMVDEAIEATSQHAPAMEAQSARYNAALTRDEPFGDDLVGAKSMQRGTIFDRRGGIRA